MAAYRKVPGFYGKDRPLTSRLAGTLSLLLGLALLIGLLNGLFVSSKTTLSEWLGWLVAGLFGILFCGILIVTGNTLLSEGAFNQNARRVWFRTAETAQTTIVELVELQQDSSYAAYYGRPDTDWYMHLKMIPAQCAQRPEETLVSVGISGRQYEKYTGQDTVTIHYSPADPFIFLLEDEV